MSEDEMQKTLTFILFSYLSLFVGNVVREPAPSPPVRRLACPATATVFILGDMMMPSAQISEGGWRESLRLIRPLLEDATVSIANMEFTLAGKPYSGYPCFSAPEDYALTAADCGIDVFLTANNHITDKGAAGLERTLRFYDRLHDSLGIFHTGCDSLSAPLFVRANNIRLGIVNATYGTNSGIRGTPVNWLGDTERLRDAVAASAAASDFTIVLPHWGEEYQARHNASQESTARFLAEAGADIIIGAHPHVVQDTASVFGVPVLYSLGNALSNMSARNTQLELMARLTLVRDHSGTHLISTGLIWLWCSRPGGFDSRYTVIPVADYADRRDLWLNPTDHDRMLATWKRLNFCK